ncbi:hypothetical protein RHGRI_017410 [Rhododendron griersonianum]|uniref:PI3K/PI4K catalytic domain-containing protein n=1 Tax=Rhododendron griersonianum TaxID=479676 RepID=A0AAV6JXQ9_9ERIC|nr:hypothetical protein RHGRI_017410 [Rhododendron griersonianum]
MQIFYHLDMSWNLRWATSLGENVKSGTEMRKLLSEPDVPTLDQHLLDSASTLLKAAAALHEFKFLCAGAGVQNSALYWLGRRLEEAKLLRAQGQHEMAINLAKYISQNHQSSEVILDVYRLVGKWLVESRSSNSRTILEKYLKRAVMFAEDCIHMDKKSITRQSQTHFHLAHYADALYRSYEERLNSSEWQAAMRLMKHKTKELEALIRRLKSSSKASLGEKTDYLVKIQELQKQLAMDKEEDERFQGDRDNFLSVALEGYKRCLVIGDKYDVRVVFRLVSQLFSLSSRQIVVNGMLNTIEEDYRISKRASRLICLHDLLALANGDRIMDKQRSRNSFVVDMELWIKSLLQKTFYKSCLPTMELLLDRVMNGVNAPKVVECLGSDGNRYRQLAKSGNDDLRQDAVGPFTPSAGVLEWVNGTLPLGEYLIGSTRIGGAHERYGKGDWTFPKCREHMTKVSTIVTICFSRIKNKECERTNLAKKTISIILIMKLSNHHLSPFCRNTARAGHSGSLSELQAYFFLERFLHPADWFEKGLTYTHSVAASSMVGYIVGLGDRHSMNILIDQATTEVVHIDLGVAFEQGLMLKRPERVPFRLTRDIIDGFIHDPLYKWALSPLKALQRQKEAEDDLETSLEDSQEEYEGNKDAAHALMRVKQKLDGYEEGEMRSVHGQVMFDYNLPYYQLSLEVKAVKKWVQHFGLSCMFDNLYKILLIPTDYVKCSLDGELGCDLKIPAHQINL